MKLLTFLMLFITVPLFAQVALFGTAAVPVDTVWMISAAADSTQSYVYYYDDYRTFEGRAGLWLAAYPTDGTMSATIIIKYRLISGNDNKGNTRYTNYVTLDSLTASQITTVRYGAGNQIGRLYNLADKADPWQSHRGIEFNFYWAPSAADTVELSAAYEIVE